MITRKQVLDLFEIDALPTRARRAFARATAQALINNAIRSGSVIVIRRNGRVTHQIPASKII